MQKRTIRQ